MDKKCLIKLPDNRPFNFTIKSPYKISNARIFSASRIQDTFLTSVSIKNLSISSNSMTFILSETIPSKDKRGDAILAEADASH